MRSLRILKFFEKFWKDFGDYKRIKTQTVPKKGLCNACPNTEQYVYHMLQAHIPSSVTMKKR